MLFKDSTSSLLTRSKWIIVLLLFILIYMLSLLNHKDIMGSEYVSGPTLNIVTWITVAVIIALTLLMVVFTMTGN